MSDDRGIGANPEEPLPSGGIYVHRPGSQVPRILVLYVTRHGQTRKVAERIATRLHAAITDVRSLPRCPGPETYDGIVAGGSVHFSRHSRKLIRY